jgi:chromosome segregation ATPase
MDNRKGKIKELETKKVSDIRARNKLLEELGGVLFGRIGEGEPFADSTDASGVLTEYRGLQKDIADSEDIIKSLEEEVSKLKELEEAISVREDEKSRLDKEFEEANVGIGKILFEDPDYHDATGAARRQEENLLAKIDEQERKLEELDKREGGVFAQLGKNVQMTLSRTLLLKNRSALRQFYRDAGEKYIASKPAEPLAGSNADAVEKAFKLNELLSSLNTDLSGLKGERRKIMELFGAEGSPSRRIEGLERHISHVKSDFTGLHLRLGVLAAENTGGEALSTLVREEDKELLEKAGLLKSQIAEGELEIQKINASINIDEEKAEIEKLGKAILGQKQKITFAEEAIAGFEKQIAGMESRIGELTAFIEKNGGIREEHGSND